jgi:ribosome-associated translation inhibitor RaiA
MGASVRIEVLGDETISPQARTYAEYAVFAALTRSGQTERFSHARVVLREVNEAGRKQRVACAVTVQLDGAAPIRVRATGTHTYAAINRAVERIRTVATMKPVSRGGPVRA